MFTEREVETTYEGQNIPIGFKILSGLLALAVFGGLIMGLGIWTPGFDSTGNSRRQVAVIGALNANLFTLDNAVVTVFPECGSFEDAVKNGYRPNRTYLFDSGVGPSKGISSNYRYESHLTCLDSVGRNTGFFMQERSVTVTNLEVVCRMMSMAGYLCTQVPRNFTDIEAVNNLDGN